MFRLNDDYTRQTIPEEGSGSHCTTRDIALHISLHIAFQWCIRLDQAEDIPNPLPPMAAEHGFISIIDSAPERGARGSCPAGRCNARASLLLTLALRRGAEHEISTPCSFAKYLSLQREGSLLGALRVSILNGPQGPQGGDLSLSQALDARDSEALVGPVTAQRAHMLAMFELPDVDGPVIAATGQPATIGTDLERLHDPLMGFSHPHARAARQVPPAQSTVTVSTDQQLLDRMPGDCIDFPRQPLQGGQALPAAGIPHEELSTALAVTPGGQLRAIGAPGHRYDGPLMPYQPLEQAATPGVPHIDLPIFAASDQAGAIGAEGHPTDPDGQLLPDPVPSACSHLPQ